LEHVADILLDHAFLSGVDEVVESADRLKVRLGDTGAHVLEKKHIRRRLEELGDFQFHTILLELNFDDKFNHKRIGDASFILEILLFGQMDRIVSKNAVAITGENWVPEFFWISLAACLEGIPLR
jgi:hypothetical protein